MILTAFYDMAELPSCSIVTEVVENILKNND
jgi:hypothetical protein